MTKLIAVVTSGAVLLVLGGCGREDTSPESAQQNPPIQQSRQIDPESSIDRNAQTHAPEQTDADANAMALYRDAQALMKDKKYDEGYATAKQAMAQFIAEDNDLAWMMLESIMLDDRRIDVHFNMGREERELPDDGIVRPLSFRVWSTGDDAGLVEIIDFEIARFGGESVSAAIGKTDQAGHANFGILPIDASYEDIKNAVVDVVKRRDDGNE